MDASSTHRDDPILKNSLFGAVNKAENAYIDKYQYSGFGIGFDRGSIFLFQMVDLVKM